jgi:hypothetical protein
MPHAPTLVTLFIRNIGYYSCSRLSEIQEPHPQPPPRSSRGGYDVPLMIKKRYIFSILLLLGC